MSVDRTYSISADMPSGIVRTGVLHKEILAEAGITKTLENISTLGDVLTVTFDLALSAGEATIFDGDTTGPAGGLLAAHDTTDPAPSAGAGSDTTAIHVDTARHRRLRIDSTNETLLVRNLPQLTAEAHSPERPLHNEAQQSQSPPPCDRHRMDTCGPLETLASH